MAPVTTRAPSPSWRDRFYTIDGQRLPSATTVLDIIATQMELVGPDPKFPQPLLRMWEAVCWLILPWIETSYLIVRDQLLTAALELAGEAALAAKARRHCREWSAAWKGIEAGLDRFCAEVDLPHAQPLAIGYPLSPGIEQARHLLDPDGRRPAMQRRRLPTAPASLGG